MLTKLCLSRVKTGHKKMYTKEAMTRLSLVQFSSVSNEASKTVSQGEFLVDKFKPPTPGSVFHELLYKGRKTNKLALGDLRKLIQLCDNEQSLKYAVLGIDLFQRKRQDFSEEVNAHFVKACIRANDPMRAIPIFSKYKNRISAWTTTTSLNRLLESITQLGEAKAMVDMLEILVTKGVSPNKASFEYILKAVVAKNDYPLFQSVRTLAEKKLSADEIKELAIYHVPQPPSSEIEPAAASSVQEEQSEKPKSSS